MRVTIFALALPVCITTFAACRGGDAPSGSEPPRAESSAAASASSAAAAVAPPAASAATGPPSSAASPSTPPNAAPALDKGICRELLDANAAKLGGKPEPEDLEAFRTCGPTPGGAWALRVDSWEKAGDWAGVETWRGTYTLVRLGRDGAKAVEGRIGPKSLYQMERGVSYTSVRAPGRFDFDGDGEPEVFLSASHKEHEGPFTSSGALLTFRNGAIAEYPGLPKAPVRMEDADGDGRPDVVYHPYAQERKAPCSGFDFEAPGPALLAHSLRDGTFSVDDAAAIAFARRSCPSASEGKDGIEPELCARLYGASEQEALAMLKKACRPPAAGDDGCSPKEGVCLDFQSRARLLHIAPPLRISP